MKLTSLCLIAACLLLAPASPSQTDSSAGGTARSVALGGGPANPYLPDLLRVHVNPALLSRYGNIVWGDVGFLSADVGQGGSRGQYLAVAARVADRQAIGLALNRRESPLYVVDGSNPSRDPIQEMNTMVSSVLGFVAQPFSRPLSPMEIFWSLNNDSAAAGVSLSYGRWSGSRSGNGDSKQSATTIRGKLGVLSPLDRWVIDLGLLVGFNDISGTASAPDKIPMELSMEGGWEAGFDVRFFSPAMGRWTIVPIARAYWFSWGMREVRTGSLVIPDPASEYSHLELEIGGGLNYRVGEVLIAGGVSFGALRDIRDYHSTKTTVTSLDLPKINLGAEIPVASWIVARIGYFDRLATTETKTETRGSSTTLTSSSELPWYGDLNGLTAAQQRITIGCGLRYEGFRLDGTIGEGYFLNGPWPFSGTAQSVFGILSVSCIF